MATEENQLNQLRDRIDTIDTEIQELINKRADCAAQVATLKRQFGENPAFYRPEREAQVLRKVKQRNQGPLDDEEIARLFRGIMSACLALEKPVEIAFLGPKGTFSHQASLKHFGPSMIPAPLSSISKVFREVESQRKSYGVVPIENSTEGVVNHTLDALKGTRLKIIGEVEIPIHHHLLVKNGQAKDIQLIYSHQQAFAQCRRYLDEHWPETACISVASTSHAAHMASEEPHTAAIASDMAAELHQLEKIATNIEDDNCNTTRFFVIGNKPLPPSGEDKTTIIVTIPHKAGALSDLLQSFAKHNVNITMLESRPSRNEIWNYVFFMDLQGHYEDSNIKNALEELEQNAFAVKPLGSYPKAVL